MAKGKIETLKIVSKDGKDGKDSENGKVEFQNWYIATPTIGSPFPEYESNRTWDTWGEDTYGADGKLYSVVSDEIEF